MPESYSAGELSAATDSDVPEPVPSNAALARELIARLLPGADAQLLVAALLAERAAPPRDEPAQGSREPELDPAGRELRRVRRQLALGEAARGLQHALNNPLTALFAEAQLLELEPLADEHRLAVERIAGLARRVADVVRRLDVSSPPTIG
jgi:signal transduction histidine kinase